jgi:Putative peptidoglycan binding domain/L,D-transpeptidase catalytic domain
MEDMVNGRTRLAAVMLGTCALVAPMASAATSASAETTAVHAGLATGTPTAVATGAAGAAGSVGSAAATATATGLEAPWARELTRYGARDVSPYRIAHVRELQYRLKWVGLFPATPTGYYGPVTRSGVKAFQARRHLPVTGNATPATWKLLLQRTVRNPHGIPATCKATGWHACYDRKYHSVTLWNNGAIYNTWLVRGGASTMQTRVGTHLVYYRDIDHVSGTFGSPMPYSQFFDGGEALHGSRMMMDPFVDHSHGCVNFYVEDARQLWNLTHDKRLWVTVYGAWS